VAQCRDADELGGAALMGATSHAFDTMPRRILIAGLAVALWMLLGLTLHLGVEAYLLAGVPLMIAFQYLVRRAPLAAAWIFQPRPRGTDRRERALGLALGMALAAFPASRVFDLVANGTGNAPILVLWWLAAATGGLIAGSVLCAQRADALRRALPTIAIAATSFACMWLLVAVVTRSGRLTMPDGAALADAITQAIVFFDVSFVLEEVAFRGILDPYLLGREPGASAAWASAVFGSALWGLWHLPVALAPGSADFITVLRIVLFHIGLGAMLCFVARTAGTLAPSAAVHGLADAFRNVLS
jgi:hypothetical protein